MKVILVVAALFATACSQMPTAPSLNDQVPCAIGYQAIPNVGCVQR